MPPKKNVDALFRKYLGRKAANELLAKIEMMRCDEKSPEEIEREIEAELSKQFKKQIVRSVISTVGEVPPPVQQKLQVKVRSRLAPIWKLGPNIAVKAKS